jgi:DNA topoisomerase-1
MHFLCQNADDGAFWQCPVLASCLLSVLYMSKTTHRQAHQSVPTDPAQAAKEAGLRYAADRRPGITRRRAGKGFRYYDPEGQPVHEAETLARIKSLAIPPAWSDVWISPSPLGHIQATGRDAKGRKQYRYHPRWRTVRDTSKYDRMIIFGKLLPRIRKQTGRDLALPGLPRRKVLAAVVRLLEVSLIRVGNDEYARNNHSFGLTTMHDRHAQVNGSRVEFRFRGKSGVTRAVELEDRRLARVVAQCQELPGQELFQYVDDEGVIQDVDSADVNDYLREIAGEEFTAKDFRTWAGTMLAALALQEFETFDSQTQAKKNVVRAIERVAERLGNTPSVCRKCYVHPVILDAYLDGSMIDALQRRTRQEMEESLGDLRPEEAAVMALLQNRLAREGEARAR